MEEKNNYRLQDGYMVYGSTVRVADFDIDSSENTSDYTEKYKNVRTENKVKKAILGLDLFHMAVLTIAIITTFYMCLQYLHVQSDIVQLNKQISVLRNDVNAAEKENDAFENSLDVTDCDLEYVYKIAVGTLGMVYPNDNKTVMFKTNDAGYVRQYSDIAE